MNTYLKVEDIIFATRAEAEDALFKLQTQAEEYGSVSADILYDIAGLNCGYETSQFIWFPHDLKDVLVLTERDGFTLNLPRALRKPAPTTPKVRYRNYYTPVSKPKPTPKTLTITINANVDDFDNVIAKTLQYAQTITDREVKIDIC